MTSFLKVALFFVRKLDLFMDFVIFKDVPIFLTSARPENLLKLQVFIKAWKWLNPESPSYADAAKSPSPFFTSKHDNLFTIQYISNLFIREAMITYYYGRPDKKTKRGWSNEELCL